jgi:hypothetical protein
MRTALEQAMTGGAPLAIWTVYDHPTDFPEVFVARKFVDEKPTQEIMTDKYLSNLRERLAERGLMLLARDPSDDEKIVETWI